VGHEVTDGGSRGGYKAPMEAPDEATREGSGLRLVIQNPDSPQLHDSEELWNASLPIARNRSSKLKVKKAWDAIPKRERPVLSDAIAALKRWNRCDAWRKDSNQFVPGLHRWITDRQWENLPETDDRPAPSRYRSNPPPIPISAEPPATPAEIAELLQLRPRRMKS
jgi:hypothetical protein